MRLVNSWKPLLPLLLLSSTTFAWATVTNSVAADLLVVVMKDDTGTKSVHYQKSQDCFYFLNSFKVNQKMHVPTMLTTETPKFSGEVIDAYCVNPDGRIWDSEGYSYKRLSR